jgi:hypothetical protein
MRRRWAPFLPAGALIAALALPAPALSADRKATPFGKRLSLEIIGGWARAGLSDVNLFPAYNEAYADFYFTRKFEAFEARMGDWFSWQTLEQTEGGFKRLRSLFPAGLRLACDIGYGWSAFVGLEYLSGRATSSYRAVYDVVDLDPDKFFRVDASRQELDFPDYRLAVRAWIPMLGARYRTPLGRRLVMETFAAAGWMRADFAWDVEMSSTSTFDKGYWSRSTSRTAVSGGGSALTAEAGLAFKASLSDRWAMFIEGTYAYRRTSRVDGDYSFQADRDDANSDPYSTAAYEMSGFFRVRGSGVSTSWGDWSYDYPMLVDSESGLGGYMFRIDMSGFELRAGLSWRF